MTLPCFAATGTTGRRLSLVPAQSWPGAVQDDHARSWAEASGFKGKPGTVLLVPSPEGGLDRAVLVLSSPARVADLAGAATSLPEGDWVIDDPEAACPPDLAVLGWALGSYRFARYRKSERAAPRLVLPADPQAERGQWLAEAICQARDLINLPANELGPDELLGTIADVGRRRGAEVAVTRGDVLAREFPMVHAVGAAAVRPPGLIDVSWGDPGHPKVTLVGKGVCFDTGGLDIKPSSNMLLMKKDMGGAAVMTGLADAIMAANLPVRLRLLVPAVENSIAGQAFRPGDVLRSRKGLTVEIGNTDAEGRLILADALALADEDRPELLLDAATLTGAARVAVGPDLPALFTPDDALAQALLEAGEAADEPLWRLPLHAPYRRLIESPVADLNNAGQTPFAGAITAALFLQSFVERTGAWAHLDIFAWNQESRPGRPKGGEATGLRALFTMIEGRFR